MSLGRAPNLSLNSTFVVLVPLAEEDEAVVVDDDDEGVEVVAWSHHNRKRSVSNAEEEDEEVDEEGGIGNDVGLEWRNRAAGEVVEKMKAAELFRGKKRSTAVEDAARGNLQRPRKQLLVRVALRLMWINYYFIFIFPYLENNNKFFFFV